MATQSTTTQPVDPAYFKQITGEELGVAIAREHSSAEDSSAEDSSTESKAQHMRHVMISGRCVARLFPRKDGQVTVDLSPERNHDSYNAGLALFDAWAGNKSFQSGRSIPACEAILQFAAGVLSKEAARLTIQREHPEEDKIGAELNWWDQAIQAYHEGCPVEQLKSEGLPQTAPTTTGGTDIHTGVELPPGSKACTRRGAKGRMRKYDYRTGDAHDIVVEAYHDGQIYLTNLQTDTTWYWEGKKQGNLWDDVFQAARRMANIIKAQQ